MVRQGHAGEGAGGALVWHSGKGRGAGTRIYHPPQHCPLPLPPATSGTLTSSAGAVSWEQQGTSIKQRQLCCKEPGAGGKEQGLAPLRPGVLGKGSGKRQRDGFLVLWCLAARRDVLLMLGVFLCLRAAWWSGERSLSQWLGEVNVPGGWTRGPAGSHESREALRAASCGARAPVAHREVLWGSGHSLTRAVSQRCRKRCCGCGGLSEGSAAGRQGSCPPRGMPGLEHHASAMGGGQVSSSGGGTFGEMGVVRKGISRRAQTHQHALSWKPGCFPLPCSNGWLSAFCCRAPTLPSG